MRRYPNLFAYLNQRNKVAEDVVLQARDRPIISLASEKQLSQSSFLIHQGKGDYEVPVPYLQVSDLEHHGNQLQYVWMVQDSDRVFPIAVTDEVLDVGAIQEQKTLEEWQELLGDRLDNTVATLLTSFTGFCESLLTERVGREAKIPVITLLEKIDKFQVADAIRPLILTLEDRYKLNKKLQQIAPKLRQQLRRRAELMPVGRIQEMDAYCLRDYTRRPGRTAAEKAGSRQELMGVKRYQDYDTAENRFLVYFAGQILHLESIRYKQHPGVEGFAKTIKTFRQQDSVKPILIKVRRFQLPPPNYVLLQNPIYNSFYRAYLDYIAKKSEKEKLWGFRNHLLADVIYICLTSAIMQFENVGVQPKKHLKSIIAPEKGRYLIHETKSCPSLRVFLQDKVYVFRLEKPPTIELGDWLLTVEIQNLHSSSLETNQVQFPIWVFWYCPTDTALQEADRYLQQLQTQQTITQGLIFYLQDPPNQISATGETTSDQKLCLLQIPDPITAEGFSSTIDLMVHLLQRILSTN